MIVAAIPYRLIPGTTLKHIFSVHACVGVVLSSNDLYLQDCHQHCSLYVLSRSMVLASFIWNLPRCIPPHADDPEILSCTITKGILRSSPQLLISPLFARLSVLSFALRTLAAGIFYLLRCFSRNALPSATSTVNT